jgi:aspartate/methionine/tyrosine aminotransferase
MNKAYEQAVKKGFYVKYIVIINPGNPTGGLMSKESI